MNYHRRGAHRATGPVSRRRFPWRPIVYTAAGFAAVPAAVFVSPVTGWIVMAVWQ